MTSPKKIYDIRVQLKDRSEWGHVGARIYSLFENAVMNLAKMEGDEIFIHRPKRNDLGGSALVVECTPDFIEKMKTLPRFESADIFAGYYETYPAIHIGNDGSETALKKPLSVYAVTTSFTGIGIVEALQRTGKLDAEIQILAKKTGADVHMHRYAEPKEGPLPCVLIECDEDFIQQVAKLPMVDLIRDAGDGPATIRRSAAPQIEPPEAMIKPPKPPKSPKP